MFHFLLTDYFSSAQLLYLLINQTHNQNIIKLKQKMSLNMIIILFFKFAATITVQNLFNLLLLMILQLKKLFDLSFCPVQLYIIWRDG